MDLCMYLSSKRNDRFNILEHETIMLFILKIDAPYYSLLNNKINNIKLKIYMLSIMQREI